MSSIKEYAREVFDELNKRKSKNAYQLFQKELNKLHDEQETETNKNDVGCIISCDCSPAGCYRYLICDFPKRRK